MAEDPEFGAEFLKAHTSTHKLACKRFGTSDEFYDAFQNPNIILVAEGATVVGESSISSSSRREFNINTIVMCTGFYFGGHILHRITRRDGQSVGAYQNGYPRAYKSVCMPGPPNVFIVGAGPNGEVWSGLAPGQIVPSYILGTMKLMDETDHNKPAFPGGVRDLRKVMAEFNAENNILLGAEVKVDEMA